jgi:uncharacterized protein YbaA (DUF1428 family)
MPMKAMKGLIGAVALACAAASAQAETFKIGFMMTLTGPSAPFDGKRMFWGGFRPILDTAAE